MTLCFGDYEIDIERRELRRAKSPVHVEPQVFDLLVYLVENRDRVVSKDDLIASVWGGRIVSNSTLTSRVDAARKTVGDSGEDQRLILTIARRGLRFVAGVRIQSNDEPAHATGPETDFRSSSLNRRLRFPRLWCVLRHLWLPHGRIYFFTRHPHWNAAWTRDWPQCAKPALPERMLIGRTL